MMMNGGPALRLSGKKKKRAERWAREEEEDVCLGFSVCLAVLQQRSTTETAEAATTAKPILGFQFIKKSLFLQFNF